MATVKPRGFLSRIYHNTLIVFIRRLLVSTVVAGPFLLAGAFGVITGEIAIEASIAILAIGGVLMAIGVYMSLMAIFPTPSLAPGERELVSRHPTMKPAYAKMVMSVPILAVALYLWQFTESPYVFAFGAMVIGLYLFFKGAMRYFRNLHITYTVTDRRVVYVYRFLQLHTIEIPASRIISISEVRSFFEALTGRGSVIVSSGIGARQTVRMEEMNDPGPVAEIVRQLMSSPAG